MSRLHNPIASFSPTALSAAPSRRGTTWQSVRAELCARIRDGIWKTGDLIPPEQDLAIELGCARATVNRALTSMAADGMVERRRRLGTRVIGSGSGSDSIINATIRTEVEAAGRDYGCKITWQETVAATHDLAEKLHLRRAAPLLAYRALITAQARPYCVETGHLVVDMLPGPGAIATDAEPLERLRLSSTPLTGRGELSASSLDEASAQLMGETAGTAVLTFERSLWTEGYALLHSRRVYTSSHRTCFTR